MLKYIKKTSFLPMLQIRYMISIKCHLFFFDCIMNAIHIVFSHVLFHDLFDSMFGCVCPASESWH